MALIWLYTLASVVAVSLVSLVGVFTLSISENRLRFVLFELISLSVGALFGDVFLHIFPQIVKEGQSFEVAMIYVFSGIVLFFILEKILRWHHASQEELEASHAGHRHSPRYLGYLNLISDGMHNFLDGIIIGVSFLVSVPVGFATALAVVLHEIPQEMGDFGLLLHSGFTRSQALGLNFLSALTALAGAVIALLVGTHAAGFVNVALPIAAGGFIYIAGSDLVPELHKVSNSKRSLVQILAMIVGFAAMFALLLLE